MFSDQSSKEPRKLNDRKIIDAYGITTEMLKAMGLKVFLEKGLPWIKITLPRVKHDQHIARYCTCCMRLRTCS